MLSPGVALGHRYELAERVGAGGYSDVWRARDLTLNRTVAVKVLHAAYVQDAEALARFRAEARHAGGLAHENIARVYDYGEPRPGCRRPTRRGWFTATSSPATCCSPRTAS